jgi:signal transduction histidine kinase
MTPPSVKSILAVDDTPANLHLLVEMLSARGYRVRTAPGGERALASIQKEMPDLILLDIMMPEMDGYEVCRRLKSDERTQAIPVIFISALNEPFDKITAFSTGGVDYITKPFYVEEVLARVQTHLQIKDMMQLLQTQNLQLQEQNRELEAFASTVAHDLKNPLTNIFSSMEIIREFAPNLDEQMQSIIHNSSNAAYKMSDIIDELLLLASVRKEHVKTTPINMSDVIPSVLERLKTQIEKYQPQIVTPVTWIAAQGYAPWIEEIWANYLSNGLKYGGQPPCLELGSTAQAEGMVKFWLRDNGKGLTPEQQAKLFTEFSQLDRIQGHGLGLSIVRRIAEKLGGQAGAESTLGEGSTFYFTLPAI